jgi:uncharacterized protein YbaP (TraB family)
MRKFCLLAVSFLLLVVNTNAQVQKKQVAKYPSLFWEITGNGLTKPSYLFGTMHVSSKMVFHLSDSFYHAIKSVDAVALELNPEDWQRDMVKVEDAQTEITKFSKSRVADFLTEKSFQLEKYDDVLKNAISAEPTIINSLLYRNYQTRADFEENTYLDLYIFQTGRKLGKQAAGVENYIETEKIVLEAYEDMAKEKKRKTVDTDGESYYDIEKKIQDAYRKGDLDLLDSLQKITATSPAFNEKFLYKRNDIQAASIDTIIKKRSLFVGVGAAHLPGDRGIIEILRKMGYKLRPIYMQDRDAEKKEEIDKFKVPVQFKAAATEDGFIQLALPGPLFRRSGSRLGDSWQYADMNNGSYYMLTRVKTHAAMLGNSEQDVMKKVDSLLYENIPGKILKKDKITVNGYQGYDITNKTRRGDIQRYQIIVTPFEVLIFKMSGNDNYVEGNEANQFFSSIKITQPTKTVGWQPFTPKQGGFAVKLPHQPYENFNTATLDRINRWEYEAVDKTTGDALMIWKKSVHNFRFLEEDTFDLSLIEESLKKSEAIDKQVSRKFGINKGVPFLDMSFTTKEGKFINAKAVIKGPHYYLLAAKGNGKKAGNEFLSSFAIAGLQYPSLVNYEDTILKIKVQTPVVPKLDTTLRLLVNKMLNDDTYAANNDTYNYYPKTKNGLFANDSTGEMIAVSVNTYPKYYFSKDSARFWRNELDIESLKKDFIVHQYTKISSGDSLAGYRYSLRDTNSSRSIKGMVLLKDNRLFRVNTLTDTSATESSFLAAFFDSFLPEPGKYGPSVFDNKLDTFFADFYSADTATRKKAKSAISNIYFGKNGIDKIVAAINKLKFGDKDYFDLKSKFIAELGYIDDSCCVTNVIDAIKDIYNRTADTSTFQNTALKALARLKTAASFSLLKELLLQDPPVFESSNSYDGIFNQFNDTLLLSKSLFPEILQLAQLEDYKEDVNDLLRDMVDSGYLKAADYESYFSQIYFDAKIQLKKQQVKEEKLLEKESSIEEDDDEVNTYNGYRYNYAGIYNSSRKSELENYAVLLMPFYDKNPSVPKFFDKLLRSRDTSLQMATAVLLLRNKKQIADSILLSIASKDRYRAKLLAELEDIEKVALFPAAYRKQQDIALSLLMNDKGIEKFAAIEFVTKMPVDVKGEKGLVYCFKYKLKKEDEWQMGISGVQPVNAKEVSSNDDLVKMTDKKLKTDEPIAEQFATQIKRLIFEQRKSARNFFTDNDYGGGAYYDDEED